MTNRIRIEIRFFGQLRDTVGRKIIEFDVENGTTLDRMFDELLEEYPPLTGYLADTEARSSSLVVMKNGTHVQHLNESDPVLDDGDTVTLSTSVAGGVT